jgi:hypothetical protein
MFYIRTLFDLYGYIPVQFHLDPSTSGLCESSHKIFHEPAHGRSKSVGYVGGKVRKTQIKNAERIHPGSEKR